jgi:rhodanese-related sulfurtransferase
LLHHTITRVVAQPLGRLDEWLAPRAAVLPLPTRSVRLARCFVAMALARLDAGSSSPPAPQPGRAAPASRSAPLEWDEAWEEAERQPTVELPRDIEAQELKSRLAGEVGPVVLDVREPYETTSGVVPGARLIPMAKVLAHIGELRELQQSTDEAIVVYCAHGTRSAGVATHLRDRGVPAVSLRGGIAQWREIGGVVTPPGPPVAQA